MLYDNALLALAYLEAYQVTREERYAEVARGIFRYVLRDMQAPEGGFYSAEDADSEGEEGKFYVWTPQEIAEVLGEKEAEIFCVAYGVTEEGNFENGKSVLNQIGVRLEEIAERYQVPLKELEEMLARGRRHLFEAREQRVRPGKDTKILTSWNGLMIAALARGGRVLGETEYTDAAVKAARFLSERLIDEKGRLFARYCDGEVAYPGYLDDYAFFTWGLTELYEATFEPRFIEQALVLTRQMLALFKDEKQGGFYFTGKDAESLFVRPKEIYDGATPSGNSVAAYNLIRLAKLTSDEALLQEAREQIRTFAKAVEASPISHSFFLMAVMLVQGKSKEILISGSPNDVKTKEMIRLIQRAYLPEAVISLDPRGSDATTIKWFVPRPEEEASPTLGPKVYICENYACQSPVTDLEELKKQLQ
jgi:uncharacterized protein YyaL (SSP411 family)